MLLLGMAIALIASEARSQSISLYDNLTAQQPDGTDSNTNFSQNPQNSLVGEDLSTVALETPSNVFRVDSVVIALRSNGTDNDPTSITQAFVEVEFFSGIMADGQASTFAEGTSLGTRRFELGDDDGDSTFGGTFLGRWVPNRQWPKHWGNVSIFRRSWCSGKSYAGRRWVDFIFPKWFEWCW